MKYKIEVTGMTKHYVLEDGKGNGYYVIRHIDEKTGSGEYDIMDDSSSWEVSKAKRKEIIEAIKEFEEIKKDCGNRESFDKGIEFAIKTAYYKGEKNEKNK